MVESAEVSARRAAWDVAQASEPSADLAQQEPATNNKRIMNLVVGTECEEMECLEEVEPLQVQFYLNLSAKRRMEWPIFVNSCIFEFSI